MEMGDTHKGGPHYLYGGVISYLKTLPLQSHIPVETHYKSSGGNTRNPTPSQADTPFCWTNSPTRALSTNASLFLILLAGRRMVAVVAVRTAGVESSPAVVAARPCVGCLA